MENKEDKDHHYATTISRLTHLVIFLIALVVILFIALIHYAPKYVPEIKIIHLKPNSNGNFTDEAKQKSSNLVRRYKLLDGSKIMLLKKTQTRILLYGKDLIEHTSLYYGEKGSIFKSSTNGMNCQNCHLAASTESWK